LIDSQEKTGRPLTRPKKKLKKSSGGIYGTLLDTLSTNETGKEQNWCTHQNAGKKLKDWDVGLAITKKALQKRTKSINAAAVGEGKDYIVIKKRADLFKRGDQKTLASPKKKTTSPG